MKKFIASITFILVFTGYALFQNGAAHGQLATSGTSTSSVSTKANSAVAAAAPPPKKSIASASTAAQGGFRDGTYTGAAANAYYGNVQVQVTVAGGKITGVTFLDYPQDRGTSRSINSYAMPQLSQEAIQAQSANVSGVSGASDTSAAFRQSLSSALSQAA
jgi:uncharacterized protein with FMN-binding domain